MNRSLMPMTSVRGRVRAYLQCHSHLLGERVLEIGSRQDEGAWWMNNRDLTSGQWLGVDMQPGPGVDQVQNVYALPRDWGCEFSGVLCSEVMEHLAEPSRALDEMWRVLRRHGWIVITTLFAFPEHSYPNDYFRYTRTGLEYLLDKACFSNIKTEYSSEGNINLTLDDHGEGAIHPRTLPMHVFAIAQKE